MSYLTQKTVKSNISFSGIALHSGHNVNVCIKPAKPDYGIVFKRVDLKLNNICLLYTSPSPRDAQLSRMPSSA